MAGFITTPFASCCVKSPMNGKLRVQRCEPLQLRYDTALIKGSPLLLNEQCNLPFEFRTTNTSNSAKMFSKLTVFFVVTAAALVGALPTTEGHGSCSTGPVQCCMYFVLFSSCASNLLTPFRQQSPFDQRFRIQIHFWPHPTQYTCWYQRRIHLFSHHRCRCR